MSGWRCWPVGCGAAVRPVSAAVLAAWIAVHPVPAGDGCATQVRCRWVIPPEAFKPGGELDQIMGRVPIGAGPLLLPPPAVPVAPLQPIPAPPGWTVLAAALVGLAAMRAGAA